MSWYFFLNKQSFEVNRIFINYIYSKYILVGKYVVIYFHQYIKKTTIANNIGVVVN